MATVSVAALGRTRSSSSAGVRGTLTIDLHAAYNASMARHFLLFYEACDGYASKRAAFRDLHLKHAWAAHTRGELVLAGALADPIDGAVILFRTDTSEAVEEFARRDPYVVNGLVTRWHVREWTTVVGRDSATPVHPAAS
jgi:uncharacterized protein YciI